MILLNIFVVDIVKASIVDCIDFACESWGAIGCLLNRNPEKEWIDDGKQCCSWLLSSTEALELIIPYFGQEYFEVRDMVLKYYFNDYAISLVGKEL